MKKIVIFSMILIGVLILAGCNSSSSDGKQTFTPTPNDLNTYDFWEYFATNDKGFMKDSGTKDEGSAYEGSSFFDRTYELKDNNFSISTFFEDIQETLTYTKNDNNISCVGSEPEYFNTVPWDCGTDNRFLKIGSILDESDNLEEGLENQKESRILSNHYDSFQVFEDYIIYKDVLEITNTSEYYSHNFGVDPRGDEIYKEEYTKVLNISLSYYAKDIGYIGKIDYNCYTSPDTYGYYPQDDNSKVCDIQETLYTMKHEN